MQIIREITKEDTDLLKSFRNKYADFILKEIEYDENQELKIYGIFIDNDLIGYCVIESAIDLASEYSVDYNDCKLISEFHIFDKYINQGYGSQLMSFIIDLLSNSLLIFLNAETTVTAELCKIFGFNDLNNGFMIRYSEKYIKGD